MPFRHLCIWQEQEYGVDDLALLPFAIKHAIWLFNQMPSRKTGLTAIESLIKTCANHQNLLRTHTWECHTFVQNPKLQTVRKF